MLFTVRLNAAGLASALGVDKMDIEEMSPKLALTLQSVFVSLLLLPIKWTGALFAARLPDQCGATMHCIATALRQAFESINFAPIDKPEYPFNLGRCLPNLVASITNIIQIDRLQHVSL